MEFWAGVLLVSAGGVALGIGLVIGTFVARLLRRYMRDEDPER